MSEAVFTVVLHRLDLGPHRTQQLGAIGLAVVSSSSVAQTLAAVAAAERGCVLVDLGVGGNAPERIARAMKPHPGLHLIACSTRLNGGGLTSRGRQLGVDRVCGFPEGALTRIFELAPDVPRLELRRTSERAVIGAELSDDVLRGVLVNLSATGALIEVANGDADVDHVSFAFRMPATADPVALQGRVCWRNPGATTTGLGVAFDNISASLRESLARFVASLNVVRIGGVPSTPAPVKRNKVRVQRTGDTRVDYFDLQGDLAGPDGAVVVPRGEFTVWWSVGDSVSLREVRGAPSASEAEVVERLQLDPDRVDGRIGWRLRMRKTG